MVSVAGGGGGGGGQIINGTAILVPLNSGHRNSLEKQIPGYELHEYSTQIERQSIDEDGQIPGPRLKIRKDVFP